MTKPEFSAIPTTYKGIQLKSRMEAQCAVLFDKLGWEWRYEPFSLMLPTGVSFIPDFWLPGPWLMVECRGYSSTRGDRQISEFGNILTRSSLAGRMAHLELPGGDSEFYDFVSIGPDTVTHYPRAGEPSFPLFWRCSKCGCWGIRKQCGMYCQPCESFVEARSALSINVRAGKIVANGLSVEDFNG